MNKNKNSIKKPKFNTYWIYSFIVLFFVSTYFIGGNETNTTSKNINITSFERFLNKGEIKEVTVINKNLAQVTLNRDALNSPDHKSANSTNFLGQKKLKWSTLCF
jgi:cell division protease FtsH